jgi:hypothetical protein
MTVSVEFIPSSLPNNFVYVCGSCGEDGGIEYRVSGRYCVQLRPTSPYVLVGRVVDAPLT